MSTPATTAARWATRLPLSLVAALDPFRKMAGWEACVSGPWLWVTGHGLGDDQKSALDGIPWQGRYETGEGGLLFEPGRLLPAMRLPAGPWRPLSELLAPAAPPEALPGHCRERLVLDLQRSTAPQTPCLIELPAKEWRDYALGAPAIRLQRLEFVLNEKDRKALIRGNPLPSLPGKRFHERDGIAMPLGFESRPRLSARTLAAVLGLGAGETALFDEHGTFARIRKDQWRPASRSIVRAISPSPS